MNTLRLLALLLLAPNASAQTFSSSKSYVGYVVLEPGGTENDAASASYGAQITLGLPFETAEIASNSYAATTGTAALTAPLSTGPPRVFGLSPAVGSKDGGTLFDLHGFNLQDGSSTANVLIGGKPTTGVSVSSNTFLAGTTTAGVNAHGNPLGPSLVRVTNGNGIGFGEDAYVYSPALVESAPPHVGQPYPLDVHLPPGSFHTVAFGSSISGLGVPVWPLEGALEVVTGFQLVTPLVAAPGAVDTVVLPIPGQPGLIGFPLELQAIVLTGLAPVSGTFTNRLSTVIGA